MINILDLNSNVLLFVIFESYVRVEVMMDSLTGPPFHVSLRRRAASSSSTGERPKRHAQSCPAAYLTASRPLPHRLGNYSDYTSTANGSSDSVMGDTTFTICMMALVFVGPPIIFAVRWGDD